MTREELQNKLVDTFNGESGIDLLAPRAGKTFIGVNYIKKMKANKALWVTPNTKLVEEDIPNEFIKWKAKVYLNKTTITTYASLHKHIGEYDIIILDEVQSITANNAINLLNGKLKTKCIRVLTGTLPEHEEKKDIIFNKLKLEILSKLSIEEAVKDDFIANYTINVIECNLDNVNKNIEAGKVGKKFKTTEAAQYSYLDNTANRAIFGNNEKLKQFAIINRMRAVYNSPTKHQIAKHLIKHLKGRKLIFAGSINQAEELSKHTYHSKTNQNDLDKFIDGKIDTLACVNAGGTGYTYTNVNHLILVQANSNKTGEVTQKAARSLLKQGDFKATIWVICLLGTKDEQWVKSALTAFDKDKINYIHYKNLKL